MTRTTTRSAGAPSPRRPTLRERRLAECEDTIAREARYWFPEYRHAFTLDDLKQEARMVVLKTVLPSFDPTRALLTTFATLCIRQHFSRALRKRLFRELYYSTEQRAAMTIAAERAERGDDSADPWDDPTEAYHRALHDEFVMARLDALPPADRRFAILFLQHKGEIRTLATVLGASHHVIRRRINAIRATLRAQGVEP